MSVLLDSPPGKAALKRAKKGLAWLDKVFPRWEHSPEFGDCSDLDISDGCNCVLGKAFGAYTVAAHNFGIQNAEAIQRGFYVIPSDPQGVTYAHLTEAHLYLLHQRWAMPGIQN